jgi:hypothetical protein
VGFRVEPTERPGTVLQAFSGFKSGSILRFSVTTRAIPARVPVPPTSGVGTNLAVHAGGIGGDLKDDEAKTTLDVKVDKLRQLEPEYRQAYLPAYLPEISSHRIDDDWGNRYLNVNFQVRTPCPIPLPSSSYDADCPLRFTVTDRYPTDRTHVHPLLIESTRYFPWKHGRLSIHAILCVGCHRVSLAMPGRMRAFRASGG